MRHLIYTRQGSRPKRLWVKSDWTGIIIVSARSIVKWSRRTEGPLLICFLPTVAADKLGVGLEFFHLVALHAFHEFAKMLGVVLGVGAEIVFVYQPVAHEKFLR